MATRAEHRASTLRRLSDAAVDVFERSGTTATVDDIAATAGLSRRTVFRWVATKEELAFVHPVLWLDVFDEATEQLATAPMADRVIGGGRAIAHFIDADPEPARRAFTVALEYPDLAIGFTTVFGRWVDRISTETLRGIETPTETERFHARIIGSAVMGVIDATTREWVTGGGEATFSEIYERAIPLVSPLLEYTA